MFINRTTFHCPSSLLTGVPGNWTSRGTSINEVVIDGKDDEVLNSSSTCRIRGELLNGEDYDYCVEEWSDVIGRSLPDGWTVGFPSKNDEEFVLWRSCPGQPFPGVLEVSSMKVAEVQAILRNKSESQ